MNEKALSAAICILNATAASSAAIEQRDRLMEAFKQAGGDVRIVPARGDDIGRHAKAATGKNSRLVLAAGGDGTINAVASALVGTDTALGVIPMGTLNHFAKDLKIPLKLEDAVANAFAGEIARIDVGEVNGSIFLNNSSLGLYPGLVQIREALQRTGHKKWPAFARALIYAFWRYSPLAVRLSLEDQRTAATTTPFVFVGNNEYELAAPHAGERASLQDGKLWIYQAPHAGRLRLARLALKALIGVQNPEELVKLEASEFWIRTARKHVRVAIDGEVVRMTSPLHYRIKPGALRVIVPRAAGDGG